MRDRLVLSMASFVIIEDVLKPCKQNGSNCSIHDFRFIYSTILDIRENAQYQFRYVDNKNTNQEIVVSNWVLPSRDRRCKSLTQSQLDLSRRSKSTHVFPQFADIYKTKTKTLILSQIQIQSYETQQTKKIKFYQHSQLIRHQIQDKIGKIKVSGRIAKMTV